MALVYAYRVKDKAGKVVAGTLESENETAAITKLRQMGYTILDVAQKKDTAFSKEISLPFFGGIKVKDLTIFSRQFATMINAGLSLTKSLAVLAEQTKKPAFSKVIGQVQRDVESGQPLSDSLAKHPKFFPPLYVSMARAGEIGGVLDEVLLRVADHFEKEANLKSRIKSAMAYPTAMFAFAMVIVFIMITFIVPRFVAMFKQLKGELPLPTKILLAISGVINSWYSIIILGVLIVLIFAWRWFGKTKGGRMLIDKGKLRLPVFGPLSQKIAIAKFSRTLGTLIATGVPILQALEIVGETSGNAVVAEAVLETRSSIREGETIAKPLSKSGVFPAMVLNMIAVGEETGALDSMLTKIADFYDSEVAATVDALTSLIEPMMIVGLGIIIGVILISLYLPMFKVITLIK